MNRIIILGWKRRKQVNSRHTRTHAFCLYNVFISIIIIFLLNINFIRDDVDDDDDDDVIASI